MQPCESLLIIEIYNSNRLENALHPISYDLLSKAVQMLYSIFQIEFDSCEKNTKASVVVEDFIDLCSIRNSLFDGVNSNIEYLGAVAGDIVPICDLYDISYHSLALRIADKWISGFIIRSLGINHQTSNKSDVLMIDTHQLCIALEKDIPKIDSRKIDVSFNLLVAKLQGEACRFSHCLRSAKIDDGPKLYLDDLKKKEQKIIDYLKNTSEYQTGDEIAAAIGVINNSDLRSQFRLLKLLGLIRLGPGGIGYAITQKGLTIENRTGDCLEQS